MDRESTVKASLQESLDLKATFLDRSDEIAKAAEMWVKTLLAGGRIYFAGNGGSAADSQHLATELVGRFERDNGFAAQALTTDTSLLTALGNDFSFDEIYQSASQSPRADRRSPGGHLHLGEFQEHHSSCSASKRDGNNHSGPGWRRRWSPGRVVRPLPGGSQLENLPGAGSAYHSRPYPLRTDRS